MSIADLEIELAVQAAIAEVPGFFGVINGDYSGHAVPRIGWVKIAGKFPSRYSPPTGWHITQTPTTPSIYLGFGYLERDQCP